MAKLHEYQGRELLAQAGVAVPRGDVAATPDEARQVAEAIGGPVVVKAQAWVTGRAALGGIRFADTPDEAADAAHAILGLSIGAFPVEIGRASCRERVEIGVGAGSGRKKR